MPHIEKHKPGSFAWMELGTSDQNAAKQFYGSLLGWTFEDHPMGPGQMVYTMFRFDGKDIAGCYSTSISPGMPPNWGVFIAVEDADAAVARAQQLGAKILRPAMDVQEYGRMAVMQDPTGAVFNVWKPKSHRGMGVTGENGTLCWADLMTDDREGAKTFYEGLFGWRLDPGKGKDPSGYLHIQNGEDYIGGVQAKPNPQAPAHWLLYFQIADCDAATAKAKQLGAHVYVPPMTIEGQLRFSVLADPQGAAFALFQPGH